jgi:hypothetical protein
VERLWVTLQHRLVVDMRLTGISTIEEANAFLAHILTSTMHASPWNPKGRDRPSCRLLPLMTCLTILCKRAFRKASGNLTI